MPTVRFQLRRDTTANWTGANPVLGPGEPSLDIDTGLIKYGDGITPWLDLPYAPVDLPDVLDAYAAGETPSAFTLSIVDRPNGAAWCGAIGAQPASDGLQAYADGDLPSAFTLSIVDAADGDAWRVAIGAQAASAALTDLAAVSPIADGEHVVAGVKITTSNGLVIAIEPV